MSKTTAFAAELADERPNRAMRAWIFLTPTALVLGSMFDLTQHFLLNSSGGVANTLATWLLAVGVMSAAFRSGHVPEDFSPSLATPSEVRRPRLTRTQKIRRSRGVIQSTAALLAVMSIMARMTLQAQEAAPTLAVAGAVIISLLALASLFSLQLTREQRHRMRPQTQPVPAPRPTRSAHASTARARSLTVH